MRYVRRRFAIVVAATTAILCSAAPAFAASSTADPSPDTTLTVQYDASGTSTVARTGSTITLAPTTATMQLDPFGGGAFTGSMPLPPTTTSFKAVGLLPVHGTVSFVPAGGLTGSLSQTPPLRVAATASYYLQLSDVTVAGVPAFVGDHCRTVNPVTIDVATPEGQRFDLTDGGELTGSYRIGLFAHCGLSTALIDLLVPGSGNTVSLTLSNGRLAGQ